MLLALARLVVAASACLILMVAATSAQTQPPITSAEQQGQTESKPAEASRTGKERLGPKWSDEQRIDDCNVPKEKRAGSARPGCEAPAK